MGAIRVIEAGPMTSVQDLGRPGFAASGVARSGAADTLSLRIGNRLLGNDEHEAALELTLVGGLFRFEHPALVCLAGAEAPGACILSGDQPRPLEPWRPAPIAAGERVRIGRLAGGARSYLCIAGGVRTEPVLGSRSTHPAGGLGNPGRPLRPGDHVETGDPSPGLTVTNLAGAPRAEAERRLARRALRVVPGAHHPVFDHAAVHALAGSDFRVHPHSDRVGLRLEGPSLPTPCGGRLASEGMIPGSIQVPPGGGAIILAADAPTTGGYPVIACVITADLPALGQLAPRDEIRFEWIDRGEAVQLLREQESLIASVGPATHEPGHGPVRVHLSCDTGEAPPGPLREHEHAMLAHVTAVSIACGGHAGDEGSMREMVRAAWAAGCLIGAHPSYPDRAGFGRRVVEMETADLVRTLRDQIASLRKICDESGVPLAFVKPHGALYHAVSLDPSLAGAVAIAAREEAPRAALVGPAGSPALECWRAMGFETLAEGFVDRVYEPDGSLRSRVEPDALITDSARAAGQALRLARGVGVVAHNGAVVPIRARTLCVHSDTPGCVGIAAAVRRALESAGVRVGAAG